MATWDITSKGGVYYGTQDGDTPAEALLALHRQAGYGRDRVWLDGGQLHFADQDTRDLLGDTCDWYMTEDK